MQMILNLPESVLCSALFGLLSPDSLCKLDTAVCSQIFRGSFLKDIIGNNHISCSGCSRAIGSRPKIEILYLKWLNLKRIKVFNVTIRVCDQEDVIVEMSSKQFTRLGLLVLNKCSIKNDELLCKLPQYLASLESLHLTNSSHVNDKHIAQFYIHCPRITVMVLAGSWNVTDASIILICATYSHKLRKLNLCKCFNTTTGLTRLSFPPISTHCRKLTYLNLSHCAVVTDTDMNMICTHCRDLKELSILGCQCLQDFSALSIARNCGRLSALDACICFFFDSEVEAIATECTELTRLSLSQNMLLTDVGVSRVALKCLKLHTLYIATCSGITDRAVINLAVVRNTMLLELNIGKCDTLTNHAVYALSEHCPALTKLNIAYCARINSLALIHMRNTLPALTELVCTRCLLCAGVAVLRIYRPKLKISF